MPDKNNFNAVIVTERLDDRRENGGAYVWCEQANTLAARDYKQPQAVAYDVE